MSFDISALELHYSNNCTHNCRICSKHHGNSNMPNMSILGYTDRIIECLKSTNLKIENVQLGGDGDPLLNKNFLSDLQKLKSELPNQRTCLYSNFELFTPSVTDLILEHRLIDELNIRFDTLHPELYKWHTNGNLDNVMSNLRYFMNLNTSVDLCIIYFPMHKYPSLVREHLNKEPTYFVDPPIIPVEEESELIRHITDISHHSDYLRFRRSGCNLWGERTDCESNDILCHHVDGFGFDSQMLIYPNGDCGLCAYCDTQNELIYGNIFKNTLDELWNGQAKKEMIDIVRSGLKSGKGSCVNNIACRFYNC